MELDVRVSECAMDCAWVLSPKQRRLERCGARGLQHRFEQKPPSTMNITLTLACMCAALWMLAATTTRSGGGRPVGGRGEARALCSLLGFSLCVACCSACCLSAQPLPLPALPYAYDAFGPVLTESAMRTHHLGHHVSRLAKPANTARRAPREGQPLPLLCVRLTLIVPGSACYGLSLLRWDVWLFVSHVNGRWQRGYTDKLNAALTELRSRGGANKELAKLGVDALLTRLAELPEDLRTAIKNNVRKNLHKRRRKRNKHGEASGWSNEDTGRCNCH